MQLLLSMFNGNLTFYNTYINDNIKTNRETMKG